MDYSRSSKKMKESLKCNYNNSIITIFILYFL